ncbi:MAG: hypothetical protein AAF192_10065 [Pseudomonadota bacterium]
MSAPAVTFVIPIRHPAGVKDPALQRAVLAQTLRSIAAQSSRDWRLRIVCNPEQVLPELPARTERVHVDLPPNRAMEVATDRTEMVDALNFDKGSRVLAGVRDLDPGDRFMVVDDDDFISRRLTAWLAAQDPARGFYVEKGWSWVPGKPALRKLDAFHRCCGSCLSAPFGLWRASREPDDPDAIREIGCHWILPDRVAGTAEALAPVPFRAAVYRMANVNSMERHFERVGDSRAFMRKARQTRGRLTTKLRNAVRHYAEFRPADPLACREFFGGLLPPPAIRAD